MLSSQTCEDESANDVVQTIVPRLKARDLERKRLMFSIESIALFIQIRKKLHPTYLGPSDNDGFAKILQHKGKCGCCVRESVRALKYLRTAFNCADGKNLSNCFVFNQSTSNVYAIKNR